MDNYENFVAIEYDTIFTSSGEKSVIVAVHADEKKSALKYSREGLLTSITNFEGTKIKYKYNIENLIGFVKSSGEKVLFENQGGQVSKIESSGKSYSELRYNGESKLIKITHKSKGVLLSDTVFSGNEEQIGNISIRYPNFVTDSTTKIIIDDAITESR